MRAAARRADREHPREAREPGPGPALPAGTPPAGTPSAGATPAGSPDPERSIQSAFAALPFAALLFAAFFSATFSAWRAARPALEADAAFARAATALRASFFAATTSGERSSFFLGGVGWWRLMLSERSSEATCSD